MSLNLVSLKQTLDRVARFTWTDIRDGQQLGISQGETSITDRSLLAIKREHPTLLMRKHPVHEEVRSGADWEWWVGEEGYWTCLLFQAKRLSDDGRYHGLTKREPTGVYQVDTLIRASWERSRRLGGTVWPMYCFYNSWRGSWPRGVPTLLYPEDPKRWVDDAHLPLYGCAVVEGQHVRRIVTSDRYNQRKTVRDTYLPYSRPWSLLFEQPQRNPFFDLSELLSRLSEWADEVSSIEPTAETHHRGTKERQLSSQRREVVWRRPLPISRVPDYVIDLLEGRPTRSRRLKPLARRVVILTD